MEVFACVSTTKV
uniref:Uncharacterized protein n=1 Tax=Anguilla anguilla TaxID=7936 RepID=A0A0E9VQV6_ANGAN